MISFRQRIIREHNRAFKHWLRLLWRLYGQEAPIVLMVHGFKPTRGECKNAFELTCASFERLMRFFMDNGWKALSQEELGLMVGQCRCLSNSKTIWHSFHDVCDKRFGGPTKVYNDGTS